MEQQLAFPTWRVVLKVAVGILANMRIVEPDLTLLDTAEGLADLRVPLAYRLHFGALQHNTRLKTIAHKVIVVSLGIADLTLVICGLFLRAPV